MPVIVNKRFSLWNRERILILLMLIISLAILFIFFKQLKVADNREDNSKPYLLLQDALACMNVKHALLDMEILEKGDGYILKFRGKKLGEKTLSGELPEYNLEIYQNRRGELYVKDLVSGMWTDADDLKLDALKEFLIIPFDLLDYYQDHFKEAVFVDTEGNQQVIKLSLPPDYFIPSIDSSGQDLHMECYFFIEEESLFINRITFLLYDNNQRKELINRTFFFQEAHSLHKWNRGKEEETRHLQVIAKYVIC